jgi:hypothetical protein
VIEVDRLSKRFGDFSAVEDTSLTVREPLLRQIEGNLSARRNPPSLREGPDALSGVHRVCGRVT